MRDAKDGGPDVSSGKWVDLPVVFFISIFAFQVWDPGNEPVQGQAQHNADPSEGAGHEDE